MVTHCALSAQHIQRFAKADPCVYVGDFNIKPGSSMYQLITEGDLDAKVLCTSRLRSCVSTRRAMTSCCGFTVLYAVTLTCD